MLFTYKAVDPKGKAALGQIEAVNLIDLEMRLKRMGLDLISGAPTRRGGTLLRKGSIGRPDLINFCFHLEQLATAGVPIVLKLENATDAAINTGDIQATQTVVAGWQTLTWVVPAGKVGPAYSWVVMLPNLGTKASASPGETYYFDDIKLGGS